MNRIFRRLRSMTWRGSCVRREFAIAGLSLALCLWGQSAARGEDVVALTVSGRVQLELPGSWIIVDAAHRQRVAEFAGAVLGRPAGHVASLAAQSHPVPSSVFVRVSFVAMSPPISQAQLMREVARDRAGALRALAAEWEGEAPAMWASLAQLGVRQVGETAFAVEGLGGRTALVIRYTRTSPGNAAKTMKVVQYHIPMGSDKVLLTLTHVEGDPGAVAAHDRVRASIRIK